MITDPLECPRKWLACVFIRGKIINQYGSVQYRAEKKDGEINLGPLKVGHMVLVPITNMSHNKNYKKGWMLFRPSFDAKNSNLIRSTMFCVITVQLSYWGHGLFEALLLHGDCFCWRCVTKPKWTWFYIQIAKVVTCTVSFSHESQQVAAQSRTPSDGDPFRHKQTSTNLISKI